MGPGGAGGPLVVVSGPPGAGKSTVAALLASRFDPSVLVAGDAFFGFLARGAIEPWRPGSHAQNEVVAQAAAAAAGRYAAGGYTTVYDGVLGTWSLPWFVPHTGLDVLHYVVLLPSVEDCVERVATRVGHGFTDEDATRAMHAQFAAAPPDARHVVTAPGASADAVAALVADGLAEGRFAHRPAPTQAAQGAAGV